MLIKNHMNPNGDLLFGSRAMKWRYCNAIIIIFVYIYTQFMLPLCAIASLGKGAMPDEGVAECCTIGIGVDLYNVSEDSTIDFKYSVHIESDNPGTATDAYSIEWYDASGLEYQGCGVWAGEGAVGVEGTTLPTVSIDALYRVEVINGYWRVWVARWDEDDEEYNAYSEITVPVSAEPAHYVSSTDYIVETCTPHSDDGVTFTRKQAVEDYIDEFTYTTNKLSISVSNLEGDEDEGCCGSCAGGTCGIDGPGNSSFYYRYSLGTDSYGSAAGYIQVEADSYSSSLLEPSSVKLYGELAAYPGEPLDEALDLSTSPFTDDISSSTVKMEVIDGTNTYTINLYLIGETNPYKTIVVKAVPSTSNSVRVEETTYEADGSSTLKELTYDFEYSLVGGGTDHKWVMTTSEGVGTLTTLVVEEVTRTPVDGNDQWTKTRIIKASDGTTVVSKETLKYEQYDGEDRLIEWVRDPDNDAITRTWDYLGDTDLDLASTDDPRYGRMKYYKSETGYWEYYVYDTQGRRVGTVKQLDNEAFSDPVNAAAIDTLAGDNIEETMEYRDQEEITRTNYPWADVIKYQVVEAGAVKKTSYDIYWATPEAAEYSTSGDPMIEVWQIDYGFEKAVYGEAGSVFTDDVDFLDEVVAGTTTGHAVTKKYYFHGGDTGTTNWNAPTGNNKAGQIARIEHPDGRVTEYDRPTSGKQVVTSGYPGYETRTTTVYDSKGNATSTYVEKYDGSGWVGVTYVATDFTEDGFGRAGERDFFFGSVAETEASSGGQTPAYTTEQDYACCGIGSTTDRAGRETGFIYDGLGRRTDVIAPGGVTTRTTYDAAGNPTLVERDGTDASDTITLRASEYDLAGRKKWDVDANGNYTFYTYTTVGEKGEPYPGASQVLRYEELRVYPDNESVDSPVQVTWSTPQGRVVRRWSGTPDAETWSSSSPPDGSEDLIEVSRTIMAYDWAGRGTSERSYYNLSGLSGLDDAGSSSNYYESTYEYDPLRRLWKSEDGLGNITINIYDEGTGRMIQQWVGTDATGAVPGNPGTNNMALVTELYYDMDRDGTGDPVDYVTRQYQVAPTAPIASTDTEPTDPGTNDSHYFYTDYETTWNDSSEERVVKTMPEEGPWTYQVYDYQGRPIRSETYHHDGMGETLIAQTSKAYVATTGNLISTKVYEVTSGVAGEYLETTYDYETIVITIGGTPTSVNAGRLVKTGTSGQGYTKTEYDNHGRVKRTVTASTEGSPSSAVKTSGGIAGGEGLTDYEGDTVLVETVFAYDDVDNVIQTTVYERNHDADTSTYPLLSNTNNVDESRVTYRATWFDDAHRQTHVADYGTNGGTAPSPGSSAPSPSATVMVTQTAYDDAGRVDEVTDNKGIVTKYFYDDMGRQIYVAENHDDFVATNENTAGDSTDSDKDRVTKFVYNAASQITEQTALMNTGTTDDQTTTYTYDGSGTDESPVKRKDLLVEIEYPDSTGSSDVVAMTYMADGSLETRTDQRSTELTFTYTESGQRESQRITNLGSDTDGSVQSITYVYDGLNRLSKITSHSDVTSDPADVSDVESQVTYEYNDLGQVVAENQQHGGVVTGSSPQVEYDYDDTESSSVFTKGSRLRKTIYPNGREVYRVYDGHGGIDDAISRVNTLADAHVTTADTPGDPIVSYTYLGSGRMARKDYPTPDVRLDYIDESGEGSTSDPYELSLDRFGRVIRHQWEHYDVSNDHDYDYFNIAHGYDDASNRQYADRDVYKSHSQYYVYDEDDDDGLHRLTDYQAGKMSYGGSSDPNGIESFWQLNGRGYTLDALGNQVDIDTVEATDYYKATHDEANQIDTRSVKGNTGPNYVGDEFSSDSSLDWDAPDGQDENISVTTTSPGYLSFTGTMTADTYGSNKEQKKDGGGSDVDDERAIALLGESIGPFSGRIYVYIPTGGQAGWVFGYKSVDDYWTYVIDDSTDRTYIYHVVDGNKGVPLKELGTTVTGNGWNVIDVVFRRGSAETIGYNFTGGFPSGQVGVYADSTGTQFDYIRVYDDATNALVAGRWIGDNHTAIDRGEGNLNLYTNWFNGENALLLDGVRVDHFDAAFTIKQQNGYAGVKSGVQFIFNATDQDDYDSIYIYHATTANAPLGYEVIDGSYGTLVTPDSGAATMPTFDSSNRQTKMYVRVIYDGTSLKVFASDSDANVAAAVASDTYVYKSTSFDMVGGMIGFASGSGLGRADDLTLKADRDDDGDGTPDTEYTEYVDDFDYLDVSGYAEDEIDYDEAGNLLFDGTHAFIYDAWNRLVEVKHAYRTPGVGDGYATGSTLATMQYDGLGRRTVKAITSAANLDTTYHYYYDGQSVIQTDNGSNQMLKQNVWGTQYIDELCQVGVNADPGNADPANTYGSGSEENEAEFYFFALQDANYNNLGVISAAGRLVERYEYTPYGQRTVYSQGVIPGDVDGDGFVGIDDLNAVLASQDSDPQGPDPKDINGDGYINFLGDVNKVLSNWNTGIPPAANNDPSVTHPRLQSARFTSHAVANAGPALCEIGHQGLFHDEEFGTQGGLIHNRARTLHPSLGRFMQRDPIGTDIVFSGIVVGEIDVLLQYQDGMNVYQYMRSNSIIYNDFQGLLTEFTNCCPCEKKALQDDEKKAQEQITDLKTSIEAAIKADKGQYPWFTKGKLKKAIRILDSAAKKLKSSEVECSPDDGPYARVFPFGNKVTVYRGTQQNLYWDISENAQAASLVHEGTHLGSATTDIRYFWHYNESPHDVLGIGYHNIASTYDNWILGGFCVPGSKDSKGAGVMCPEIRVLSQHFQRANSECPPPEASE